MTNEEFKDSISRKAADLADYFGLGGVDDHVVIENAMLDVCQLTVEYAGGIGVKVIDDLIAAGQRVHLSGEGK